MFDGTENIYKVAFDTTLEGVIFTDINAKVVSANKSVEDLLGYRIEEVIGADLHIFVPKHLHKIHRKHYKAYFENPDYLSFENFREIEGVRKDGSIVPLELRLNLFEFKGKKYAKATLTDITKRKEKEKKLQSLKMELEEKVEDNTKQLKRLVLQLQKSNVDLENQIKKKNEAEDRARKALVVERELSSLKTRFLSLASHEFRTPLSGILTSAILISKNIPEDKHKITKHVNIIKTMVNHLSNILDDFMSLEKLESGDTHYKFTSFEFNGLMDEIIKEANSLLKKGQTIVYEPCYKCPKIYQDRKIVKIILNNLLYNAIKYSPENSPINIEVKTDLYVIITISDKGIGIPEVDKQNIFKRFFRASNATHLQGTGIGLNIVKANVEGLGGSISFKSKENEGSTFIVKLPKNIV
jgi:PAS domain S-box-containing protein